MMFDQVGVDLDPEPRERGSGDVAVFLNQRPAREPRPEYVRRLVELELRILGVEPRRELGQHERQMERDVHRDCAPPDVRAHLDVVNGRERGGNDEIEQLAAEALSYMERGFTAVKVKIGFGFDYDVAAVRAVRRALGDDAGIMVDANHAYNASTAIQLGKRIEEYRVGWFEEPVPPEDIEGYREVKAALSIPVAGGEAEFTRYGFHRLLQARAVDILQPDCTVTGGISEFLKIVPNASPHPTLPTDSTTIPTGGTSAATRSCAASLIQAHLLYIIQ
jgi:L-alanine-DL-glutamate epimerase-like enolase superfamily enzyme